MRGVIMYASGDGGHVGYDGVPVRAQLDPMDLFAAGVQLA